MVVTAHPIDQSESSTGRRSFERLLPYFGIPSAILFAVATFAVRAPERLGSPDSLRLMQDNEVRNLVGVYAGMACGVTLLFFVVAVPPALQGRAASASAYCRAAFAAGVLVAGSMVVRAWVLTAGIDAAGQGDTAGLETILYLGSNDWMLWVVPSAVFYVAIGLGARRSGTLPKWFSRVTTALGVMCLLVVGGFVALLATPLWLIVASVVLARQQQR